MTVILNKKESDKIKLIDDLRENLDGLELIKVDWPQIVVIGDQSSGKSSVLQAISNIDLPRGTGTVTLCPTVIQMREDAVERTLQIKFRDGPYKIVDDSREAIQTIQRDLNGKITSEKITMIKKAAELPNLTIIDLPGLISTPNVNQSKNIVNETRQMAEEFMCQRHSLILCVLSANQDIQASSTILLAKNSNPDMDRIIGVLTKVDTLHHESNEEMVESLNKILLNQSSIEIKKGFYGVCVSNEYLSSDSIARGHLERQKLLDKYPRCVSRLGVANLTKVLQTELTHLINKNLPVVYKDLETNARDIERRIDQYSIYSRNKPMCRKFLFDSYQTLMKLLDQSLTTASSRVSNHKTFLLQATNHCKQISAVSDSSSQTVTFRYVWEMVFEKFHSAIKTIYINNFTIRNAPYKSCEMLMDKLEKSQIDPMSIFVNSTVFYNIIGEILQQIKKEALDNLSVIEQMTRCAVNDVIDQLEVSGMFEELANEIRRICMRHLDQSIAQCKVQLEFLIKSEQKCYCPRNFISINKEQTKEPSKSPDSGLHPLSVTDINQSNGYLPRSASIISSQLSNNKPLMTNGSNSSSTLSLMSNSNPMDNLEYSDKNSYYDIKLYREHLDNYVKELNNRLKYLVPNFISSVVFDQFVENIKDDLTDFITSEFVYKYFELSDHDKRNLNQYESTLKKLNDALLKLKEYL